MWFLIESVKVPLTLFSGGLSIARQYQQCMFFVSFGKSTEHDHFIVSVDAKMPRIDRPVTVLVKVRERCRRRNVHVRSHEGSTIGSHLYKREREK